MTTELLAPECITDKLERLYGSLNSLDCAPYIEFVENFIAEDLRQETTALAIATLEGAEDVADYGFAFDHDLFRVVVAPVIKGDCLTVAIVADSDVGDEPVETRVRLTRCGRYSGFVLMLPPALAHIEPVLCAFVKQHLERGYGWLREFVLKKADQIETNLGKDLLSCVRVAFSTSPQLADMVWLALIREGVGAYLFDSHLADTTLKLFEGRRGAMAFSPASLLVGATTSAVPLEKMFARNSLAESKSMVCDLAQSEYLSDVTAYAIAEQVFFKQSNEHDRKLSIYAIVREKQPFLVAAYPTRLEPEVLPVLQAHEAQFASLMARSQNSATALWRKLRQMLAAPSQATSPYGQAGEAVGGFIRGLLGIQS